jgi:hypothetical protein
LAELENELFLVSHFDFFFSKKSFFLLHSHENKSKFNGQQGWVKILIEPNVMTLFDPCQTFCIGNISKSDHYFELLSTHLSQTLIQSWITSKD